VRSVLPHKPQTCQSLRLQTNQFEPNGRNSDINIVEVPVCVYHELVEKQTEAEVEVTPNWKNMCNFFIV
jgi:hypothetical protein